MPLIPSSTVVWPGVVALMLLVTLSVDAASAQPARPTEAAASSARQTRCLNEEGRLYFVAGPCPALAPAPVARPSERKTPQTTPFAYRIRGANYDSIGMVGSDCEWVGRLDKSGSDTVALNLSAVFNPPNAFMFCRHDKGCPSSALDVDIPVVDVLVTSANAAVMRRIEAAVASCQAREGSSAGAAVVDRQGPANSVAWWRMTGTKPDGTQAGDQIFPWTGRLPK